MHRIRAGFVALALVVAVGATPALATAPVFHFAGASPSLAFGPPTCQVGVQTCTYEFTNEGTGSVGGRTVTWRYEERGTVLPDLGQRVDAATYALVPLKGDKEKPGKAVVLRVVPGSYRVSYDDPATAPCSSGTFSADTEEGAVVQGTFACLGGLPSASMDFTIDLGDKRERALDD